MADNDNDGVTIPPTTLEALARAVTLGRESIEAASAGDATRAFRLNDEALRIAIGALVRCAALEGEDELKRGAAHVPSGRPVFVLPRAPGPRERSS